jgi:hypothetical protein
MEKLYKENTFMPFTSCWYWESANGDERPCACLDGFEYKNFTYALDILYLDSYYRLKLFPRNQEKEVSGSLEEIKSRATLDMVFNPKGKDYDRAHLSSSGYQTMAEVKERILAICASLKKFVSEQEVKA